MKKKLLILDNDGTLSKFKKKNFKNTIGEDLINNVKNYIIKTLNISEKEYKNIIERIKSDKMQLSKGFEKIGINRKEYFHETWKNLSPEKYLIKRNNKKLEKLIKSKEYKNIMITGAPKIWFQKSLKYLGYKENIFELIYTAEDFYNKKEIFEQLNKNNKFDLKKSIAIGDEKNDYVHLERYGGKAININLQLKYYEKHKNNIIICKRSHRI